MKATAKRYNGERGFTQVHCTCQYHAAIVLDMPQVNLFFACLHSVVNSR